MRWLGSGAWVAAACVWCGCSSPPPYDRAQYSVGSVASVLFSNTLVVTREVLPRKSASGSLEVEYALLFQNEGAEAVRLLLSEATAQLNGLPERATVRCAAHGYLPSAALSLPPGQRLRLDCTLGLTAQGVSDARSADTEIVFELPVLSGGRLVTPSFEYRLKLEDAT